MLAAHHRVRVNRPPGARRPPGGRFTRVNYLMIRAVLSMVALIPSAFAAERTVTINELLRALMPDVGASRDVAWAAVSGLAVTWESAEPVAAEDWLKREGFMLRRTGTARLIIGGEPPIDATIVLQGTRAGFQQALVSWNLLSGPFDSAMNALRADGFELTPLKCDREREGASYGNVVWMLSSDAKRAIPLGENWDCAQNGCRFTLTIFKSPQSVDAIECYSGG